MIECPACTESARKVSHYFMAHCQGCAARSVGRMPQFAASRKAGYVTSEYRRLLQQMGVSHDEVKAAVAADRLQSGAEEP